MAGGIDYRMVLPPPLVAPATMNDVIEYLSRLADAIAGDHDDIARAINELVDAVNPVSGQTYTVSNVSTDRTFDANSTTLDEVADVLGTLITDLKTRGVL